MGKILKSIATKTAAIEIKPDKERPVAKAPQRTNWIVALGWMNQHTTMWKKAKDFCEKDGNPMSKKLLGRLKYIPEIKELCKAGKYAKARKLIAPVGGIQHYKGFFRILNSIINNAEKTGKWEEIEGF